MLDNPEKTARLFAALKAAVPFDVELMPALIKYLQTEDLAAAERIVKPSRTCHTPATRVASCATSFGRKKKPRWSSP